MLNCSATQQHAELWGEKKKSSVRVKQTDAHLLFDLYTVLRFKDEGNCLHDLLPVGAHDLVNVLTK